MAMQIDAAAILRQWVLQNLRQHRAGAVGHQEDLVGEVNRLIDVMRDHERGLAGLKADAADFVLQRAARQCVERGEWLVHQHDLRHDRESARDADALFHAAGQFGWALMLGSGEADDVDEFLRMGTNTRLVPLAPFRRDCVGDVAHHRAPRQQRVALEDHGAVEAGAFDGLAIDDDSALARLIETGENVEYSGLAAAGMTDHAAEFAARHRKPQVLENRRRAAVRRRIALGDAFDGDKFLGHRFTPGT